jgi:hypothetical protein
VSTHARTQTRDQRKDGSDCSYEHQDDANRVNVESMLVGIYRQGEIQNGSNCKDNDARCEPTDHLTCSLRGAVSLALIVAPLLDYLVVENSDSQDLFGQLL